MPPSTPSAAAAAHPWVPVGDPWAALPKAVLHDHLDGSIDPRTLVELVLDAGEGARLATTDPGELEAIVQDRSDRPRAASHGDLFAMLCAAMQTRASIERVAREYVAAAVADGIVYAEVRWAPEKHLDRGLSMDDAVEAVRAGLAAGADEAAAAGRPIEVRQLLCGIRTSPPEVARDVARLAVRHRDERVQGGVVGFDLAGVEIGFPAASHLAAFDLCHDGDLPTTCHAGEFDGAWNVGEAVRRCHARRIGHGTRLVEDLSIGGVPLGAADAVERWEAAGRDPSAVELHGLARSVRDRRIPLEQCPTSNSGWVVPSFERHPIDLLHRLGFTVTVNPDNRLLSGTSVTGELRRLAGVFGWTLADVRQVTVQGVDAAFVDRPTRDRLLDEVVRPGFDAHAGVGGVAGGRTPAPG